MWCHLCRSIQGIVLCKGCALHLGWTRWWEGAQVPPVKEMQEVCASWWWYSPLPQVTSPVWVWANLAAGRSNSLEVCHDDNNMCTADTFYNIISFPCML